MQFIITSVAAILALTASIAAKPLNSRASLQDWQVSVVSSFTPSGRPGSYPWSTITANITDPNQIDLGKADDGTAVTAPAGSKGLNCQAKVFTKSSESPVGRTWPCDAVSDGYWVMNVLPGSTGSFTVDDFVLKFTHVADLLYQGAEFTASYTAQGSFKVGDALGINCGASGVCSRNLKKLVTIKPKGV